MVISNQKVSPVLKGADDWTKAARLHLDFSPKNLSNPKEVKALSEGGEVAITMYGFVGAGTWVPSDLAVAADIEGNGGASNHDTYLAHPLQRTGIQLVIDTFATYQASPSLTPACPRVGKW
jgi:hypothetical protein